MKPQVEIGNVIFNLDAIKREYQAHTSRCQQIAKEVNKWGKKTKPEFQFLNQQK